MLRSMESRDQIRLIGHARQLLATIPIDHMADLHVLCDATKEICAPQWLVLCNSETRGNSNVLFLYFGGEIK